MRIADGNARHAQAEIEAAGLPAPDFEKRGPGSLRGQVSKIKIDNIKLGNTVQKHWLPCHVCVDNGDDFQKGNENRQGLPAIGGTTGQGSHETPDKEKLMVSWLISNFET